MLLPGSGGGGADPWRRDFKNSHLGRRMLSADTFLRPRRPDCSRDVSGCSSRNRGNSHRAGNLPLAVEADAAAVSPDGMPDSDRGGFYSDIRTGAGSSSVSCDRSVSWLSHGYAVSISDARGSSGGKICTGGDDFRVEAFSGGGAEPDGSRNPCLRSEGGDPPGERVFTGRPYAGAICGAHPRWLWPL